MTPSLLFPPPRRAADEERARRRARLVAVVCLSAAVPLWALTGWLVLQLAGCVR